MWVFKVLGRAYVLSHTRQRFTRLSWPTPEPGSRLLAEFEPSSCFNRLNEEELDEGTEELDVVEEAELELLFWPVPFDVNALPVLKRKKNA